ncbi:MAG: hypothetical protein LC107_06655 [Chitinophagales bacterium]|nr:hypothetical protein [Chitinophagales bacterium]
MHSKYFHISFYAQDLIDNDARWSFDTITYSNVGFVINSIYIDEIIDSFGAIIVTEISIHPSHLYKNWNEDFWRIKPPEFRDTRPFDLLDRDTLDRKYKELKKSDADLSGIGYEYNIRGIELPKKFLFW